MRIVDGLTYSHEFIRGSMSARRQKLKTGQFPTTASLDRIDSTKSYHKDNIQWVHKRVNRMKMNYTMEEFVDWCKKVAHHFRKNRK